MNKTRILVTDNNRFYTRLIGDHLRERGFEVREATTGAETLRLIDEEPPDLLILDLVMPEVDGVQVCGHLRAQDRLRQVGVIILSGILPEEIENLKRLGARAFVAKMQADKILEGIDRSIEWIQRGEEGVNLEGFQNMHRREVVQELLEELRARSTLLESLSEGAAAVNPDGVVVYCNEAFAVLLEMRAWEPIGRRAADCFGEASSSIERLLADLRKSPGRLQRLEIELRGRHFELRASSLRRPGSEAGTVLLLEDISARRRAEREREALQHQLMQHEKLSALGRLVSGVAHELNNPLTGVIGYSQLLLGRSTNAKFARQLERIYSQACRCQKIIQNLIIFGQRHAPIRRHLGLNGILKKVLEVMALQLKLDGIEVVTDFDPKLPLTMVDYDQIRQVFMNLINNAHQAMTHSAQKVLQLRTRAQGERVLIEFQDSGPGVPPDLADKVFEPFFTTREIGQGVGLGLSVSYSVVREHGGSIRIGHAPQGGALVSLELPVSQPDSQRSGATGAGGKGRSRVQRVLVADDEPVILDLMVDLLGERGYRVDTAVNGREALAKLSAGRYDAVVLDLRMPEMDGIQLYQEMARHAPALRARVVFATGDTVEESTRKFLAATGQPVLTKPFEIDKVLGTLEGLLSAETSREEDPETVSKR